MSTKQQNNAAWDQRRSNAELKAQSDAEQYRKHMSKVASLATIAYEEPKSSHGLFAQIREQLEEAQRYLPRV